MFACFSGQHQSAIVREVRTRGRIWNSGGKVSSALYSRPSFYIFFCDTGVLMHSNVDSVLSQIPKELLHRRSAFEGGIGTPTKV